MLLDDIFIAKIFVTHMRNVCKEGSASLSLRLSSDGECYVS